MTSRGLQKALYKITQYLKGQVSNDVDARNFYNDQNVVISDQIMESGLQGRKLIRS